jgi:hypothetical protein
MGKTVVIFDKAKRELMTGGLNLSDTFRVALLSAGWTPSIDTSSVASLTAYFHAKASAGQAVRQIMPIGDFTKTADGVLKFDLSDIAVTASSGENICARYGVIYGSGQTVPLAYWELSTAEVVASQINIQWDSAGVFETSDNV